MGISIGNKMFFYARPVRMSARLMFENIQWLVDHHPPGTKFLLDGHNNHIAAEQHTNPYTGQLLREHWGAHYVTIGFSFSEGSRARRPRRRGAMSCTRPDIVDSNGCAGISRVSVSCMSRGTQL
jgi:erythromycin esterase-like protein